MRTDHPSFAVYPDTRSLYCFGCNAGGPHAERLIEIFVNPTSN